jgi:hypothetical protein
MYAIYLYGIYNVHIGIFYTYSLAWHVNLLRKEMEKIRWNFSLPGENNSNHVEFITKNSQHLLFYKNMSYKYLGER